MTTSEAPSVNLLLYANSAIFKLLWSGLFYYHIRNLASKYIRFILTSNSSLLFLISATVANLILYIQFLTQASPLQPLHIYEYTNIKTLYLNLLIPFVQSRKILIIFIRTFAYPIQLVVTKVCVTTNEASVAIIFLSYWVEGHGTTGNPQRICTALRNFFNHVEISLLIKYQALDL